VKRLSLVVTLMGLTAMPRAFAADAPTWAVYNPCGAQEHWEVSGSPLSPALQKEFVAFIQGKRVRVQGFGDALAMRSKAHDAGEKAFSEYWMGRAFFGAGIPQLAFKAFQSAALSRVPKEWAPLERALVGCMVQIVLDHPAIGSIDSIEPMVQRLSADDEIRQDYYAWFLRSKVATSATSSAEALKKLTQEPWKSWGRLLVAVAQDKHEQVIEAGRLFLANQTLPASLERDRDVAKLYVGRALYASKKFPEAVVQYGTVPKSSNELTKALSEMAWAQLLAGDHQSAIGSALNLQAGAFRRVFTPEAPMVMAMAFNELCLFPDSLKALEYFRTHYTPSFNYLQELEKKPQPLYPQLLAYLAKKPGVPDKIASEWIRSPYFLSRQDRMTLYGKELKAFEKERVLAVARSRELIQEIFRLLDKIRPEFERIGRNIRGREDLPAWLKEHVDQLKVLMTDYRRLKQSAGPWQMASRNHEKISGRERAVLIGEIEKDLSKLNREMKAQIQDVADNLNFLEVEIFEGATKDIVFQNAHPDFAKAADGFKKDEGRATSSQTWSWGPVRAGYAGTQEVWEDELGAFRADVLNNCQSKDKYLTLRKRVGGAGR
jgi:hypothetical protein